MKRFFSLALGLSLVAGAEPKLTLEVNKSSDAVELKLVSSEPIKAATQRWRENPHRLEVVIPKAKLAGKTHKLDRGVVQKLEVKSTPEAAVLELYALQNPKMRWTGSADGKEWSLKVLTTELASDSNPPALPLARAAAPAAAKPSSASPASVPARPPVASQPKPKNGSQPVAPRPDQRPVSLTLEKKPLAQAIRELAQCAGMQADVGPGVEGSVTATFNDVPLARALTQILGQQEKLYEYKIVNNRLQVFGDNSGSGATMIVPGGGPSISSPPPTSPPPASSLTSDYYPIRIEHSVREAQEAVRSQFAGIQVWTDERLNVLFVRGQASELEKVRQLLASLLAK